MRDAVRLRSRRPTTTFVVAPGAGAGRPLRVAAYDFGMKWNILRRFAAHGCDVRVYPATTPAAELLATKPDGVFLSNGPGDPAVLDYAIDNAQDARRERRADVRHLPRPSDSRPGDGRADVQAQVRPPRREPSGEGSADRARSRSRRRTTASPSIRRLAAARRRGDAPESCTTARSKACATRRSRSSACSTTRKPRPARTTRTTCSTSSSTRWRSARSPCPSVPI